MSLQNFILQEALKTEHAARFILFQERYNTQVLLDLKKALEKEWAKDVTSLSKKHVIAQDDIQFAQLQNPKAVIELALEPRDERIISSRHREAVEVSPSVKIPLLYKRDERDLIIETILKSAETAFKEVADSWREIFRVEKKGRATPWFKLVHDKHELRFQLALTDGDNETYKTLYAVRVEYGKLGTKTRDFDRVYLISV